MVVLIQNFPGTDCLICSIMVSVLTLACLFTVWSVATKKMEIDLPGHADEVFTVDWSPDGQRVVSGGKDKVLKM